MASLALALALSVEGEAHGGAVSRASLPLDARLERGWRVGGKVGVLDHRCAGGCGELTPASHIHVLHVAGSGETQSREASHGRNGQTKCRASYETVQGRV